MHPDPPELITERHLPREGSGGSTAAPGRGVIPGTGVRHTHPPREGSPQKPTEGVAAPPLRQPEAIVEESKTSYLAGRGEIQTDTVCSEPTEGSGGSAVAPDLGSPQQQANQSFPIDSKESEKQTDAETKKGELKR